MPPLPRTSPHQCPHFANQSKELQPVNHHGTEATADPRRNALGLCTCAHSRLDHPEMPDVRTCARQVGAVPVDIMACTAHLHRALGALQPWTICKVAVQPYRISLRVAQARLPLPSTLHTVLLPAAVQPGEKNCFCVFCTEFTCTYVSAYRLSRMSLSACRCCLLNNHSDLM